LAAPEPRRCLAFVRNAKAQSSSKQSPSSKAQLSLEALIAFAALISAFSLLIFVAQQMGSALQSSAVSSSSQYSQSFAALCLDEAAQSMRFSHFNIPSARNLALENQPLFYGFTQGAAEGAVSQGGQEGQIYASQADFEPV